MFNDLITQIIPRRFHMYGAEERLAQENYYRVIPSALHIRFQTLFDEQISIFCADGNVKSSQLMSYSIERTNPPGPLFNGCPRYQFHDLNYDEQIIVWSFGLCFHCRQPIKLIVSRSRSGIAIVEEHSCQKYFLSHDLMNDQIHRENFDLIQTRSLVLKFSRWCQRYESLKKETPISHSASMSAIRSHLSDHWTDLIHDLHHAIPNG